MTNDLISATLHYTDSKCFMKKCRQIAGAAIVVVVVFYFFSRTVVRDRGDSRYVLHVADSILRDHDTNLDEYTNIIKKDGIYDTRVLRRNGHIYSVYPPGTSLLTLPFLGVINTYSKWMLPQIGIDKHVVLNFADTLDGVLADIFALIGVILIYTIGLYFVPWYVSVVVAIAMGLGTSIWTSAARSLWPHGPLIIMVALALLVLLKFKKNLKLAVLCALPLAFGFVIRPTGIIPLTLIGVYIAIKSRRYAAYYFLVSLIILVPFFIYNFVNFGKLLSPFYYPQGIHMLVHTHGLKFSPEALLGNLVSPNRGLFIYSSFLVFAVGGILWLIFLKKMSLLSIIIFLIIMVHWILISSYSSWWGGWDFGPRYFADVMPFFAYFLYQFISLLRKHATRRIQLFLAALMVFTIGLSIAIEYRGAHDVSAQYWNSYPLDVDYHPERVWDWHDLQFLRVPDEIQPVCRYDPLKCFLTEKKT
jgi:hypothetical protein